MFLFFSYFDIRTATLFYTANKAGYLSNNNRKLTLVFEKYYSPVDVDENCSLFPGRYVIAESTHQEMLVGWKCDQEYSAGRFLYAQHISQLIFSENLELILCLSQSGD